MNFRFCNTAVVYQTHIFTRWLSGFLVYFLSLLIIKINVNPSAWVFCFYREISSMTILHLAAIFSSNILSLKCGNFCSPAKLYKLSSWKKVHAQCWQWNTFCENFFGNKNNMNFPKIAARWSNLSGRNHEHSASRMMKFKIYFCGFLFLEFPRFALGSDHRWVKLTTMISFCYLKVHFTRKVNYNWRSF